MELHICKESRSLYEREPAGDMTFGKFGSCLYLFLIFEALVSSPGLMYQSHVV